MLRKGKRGEKGQVQDTYPSVAGIAANPALSVILHVSFVCEINLAAVETEKAVVMGFEAFEAVPSFVICVEDSLP